MTAIAETTVAPAIRAEPGFFVSNERPLFGWLHRADASVATRNCGVVICNPFGYEVECSHRALRHFAQAANAVGMPVMRFDYDGTGDSAGDDSDPDRWQAWKLSVHAAVHDLRDRTGVERVCLLGVRLGAALAAECAAERDDVVGLVAIGAVVSGRQMLREMKALQSAMAQHPAPATNSSQPEPLESVGIVITEETQKALAAVDLLALDRAPAPNVLILDRNDRPANHKWIARLDAQGTNVSHEVLPGFVEMMLDPHESLVPQAMIEATRNWLDSHFPETMIGNREPSASDEAPKSALVGADIRETPVFVDKTQTLFGIVTESKTTKPTRAILLLNSGAIPHTGHGRMYVRFARHLANHGYLVLRCDISGIGDSLAWPGRNENDVYSTSASRDIELMLTHLRAKWGVQKIEAIGICSGAYHAFKAAVAGTSLDGVTVINPLTFFWKDGMTLSYPAFRVSQNAVQYRRSVLSMDKWRKLLTGGVNMAELAKFIGLRTATLGHAWLRSVARTVGRPIPDDIGAELQTVARRRVPLRFVFAVGEPGEDLLRVGAGRSLNRLMRKGAVTLQFIDGPDHSFSSGWMQRALLSTIERSIAAQ